MLPDVNISSEKYQWRIYEFFREQMIGEIIQQDKCKVTGLISYIQLTLSATVQSLNTVAS